MKEIQEIFDEISPILHEMLYSEVYINIKKNAFQ